jgi:endo-1,4-beta-xylanase
MMKNRLTSIVFLAILISCQTNVPTRDPVSLKNTAPFPVGTAASYRQLMTDDSLRAVIVNEFNSITSENDMKMYSVMPRPGEFSWQRTDSIVAFCSRHNMRLFGHALVWHSATPRWLTEAGHDSTSLSAFMKDYIHTYVSRYKGVVDGWDVVNEPVTDSAGTMRETYWYNMLGETYIDQAFFAAHDADPKAILFINDYNTERDPVKLKATIDLINRLKSRGVPISGIGLQMHTRMDIPDEIIAWSLQQAAATGLQVHLSEVDIIFNRHNDKQGGGEQIYDSLTREMEQAQADKYRRLAQMYREFVPENQQYGITFWGFNDRTTWINGFFKLKDWPTIFDENLRKKPAYYGFLEGLSE